MQAYKLEGNRMSEISKILQEHEGRVTRIELSIESINQTLIRLEKRMESIDNKMDGSLKVLDNKIDVGFKSLNDRLWNNFYWMIGGFTGVLGILARVLHWI